MVRIVCIAGGLALAAVACAPSSRQLQPMVEGGDPTHHLIASYDTVLSYEPGSAVAVSGALQGDELVVTVAIRNWTGDGLAVDPEGILVAAGDPASMVTMLPTFSPIRYLESRMAAAGTKLAIRAESLGAAAAENVRIATETTRLDDVPLDAAGSFLGRSDASEDWTSLARRSAEVRGEADALLGHLDALSHELLWAATLEPGATTYGRLHCPALPTASEYRVIVPVGADLHEFVLVADPGAAHSADAGPAALSSN